MVKQVLGKSSVNVFPIALGTNAVGGIIYILIWMKSKAKKLFVKLLIMV